jgi:hypothetical protein
LYGGKNLYDRILQYWECLRRKSLVVEKRRSQLKMSKNLTDVVLVAGATCIGNPIPITIYRVKNPQSKLNITGRSLVFERDKSKVPRDDCREGGRYGGNPIRE